MNRGNVSFLAAHRSGDPTNVPGEPVASLMGLHVTFRRPRGRIAAVRGVTLSINPAEIVGIVGESGSGKSLMARAMMGLLPRGAEQAGRIIIEGQDVLELYEAALRKLRGMKLAMIFQDPMSSFNPVRQIGDQIGEAMAIHRRMPRRQLRERVLSLLSKVGIINPREQIHAYPHEMSGGMRQRALIAMGLANNPSLLIADEPTTALDVTVQDQVLELIRRLNEQAGTAVMLITHNIAITASLCSRVVVMYAGCVVEDGPVDAILARPQHPYSWMLIRSLPRVDRQSDRLIAIQGHPPDPAKLPSGCKFHPRCPFAIDRCREEEPDLVQIGQRHSARCFILMDNISAEACDRV